jgi:hypothetical protein
MTRALNQRKRKRRTPGKAQRKSSIKTAVAFHWVWVHFRPSMGKAKARYSGGQGVRPSPTTWLRWMPAEVDRKKAGPATATTAQDNRYRRLAARAFK